MQEDSEVYVGLDTAKLRISVALAQPGRDGEVRFPGGVDSAPEAVERLVRNLAKRHRELFFAYGAGPTGYGLQRQIAALGHDCAVVAPSLVPRRPGERVKANRRDAPTLARLHRAGELTPVWVPDPGHEAMRELVRAREAAVEGLRAKRRHLRSFLLRHGRVFTGRGAWTEAHTRWPCELRFEHPAQHLVLAEYRQAILDAEARRCRGAARAPDPAGGRVGAVLVHGAGGRRLPGAARRGLPERGHLRGRDRRRAPLRQPAAADGLPRPGAVRELDRRAGAARRHHRGRQRPGQRPGPGRVLIEGAWTHRLPARMSRPLQERQAGLPKAVCDIAWEAQLRLCGRYRKLMARGKRQAVVTTAIAREMAAFLWAIGREVEPRSAA